MDNIIVIIILIMLIISWFLYYKQFKRSKLMQMTLDNLLETVDMETKDTNMIDLEKMKKKIMTGSNSDLTKYAIRLYESVNKTSISEV